MRSNSRINVFSFHKIIVCVSVFTRVFLLGYKRKTLIMMMLMNKKAKRVRVYIARMLLPLLLLPLLPIIWYKFRFVASQTVIFTKWISLSVYLLLTLINSLTHSLIHSVNLCNCFYLHFSALWCAASGVRIHLRPHSVQCSMCYEIDMCTLFVSKVFMQRMGKRKTETSIITCVNVEVCVSAFRLFYFVRILFLLSIFSDKTF